MIRIWISLGGMVIKTVHIKHTTAQNGADVHQNLSKKTTENSVNTYGIGLRVRIRVRHMVRVSVYG